MKEITILVPKEEANRLLQNLAEMIEDWSITEVGKSLMSDGEVEIDLCQIQIAYQLSDSYKNIL